MAIDDKQVKYKSFLSNEVKTLGIISKMSPVYKAFPELCRKAGDLHVLYKAQKGRNQDLKFGCKINMSFDGRHKDKTSFYLEANIKKEYSEAVYQFSICENEGTSQNLIRKFHFDYDPRNYPEDEKRAKYHLQYGGLPTPELTKDNISTEGLHSWLSIPRIPISPVNLALFLDIVFCEFINLETKKIVDDNRWREMIMNNEKLILSPYYRNASEFVIGNSHKSTYLFRDFVYGK